MKRRRVSRGIVTRVALALLVSALGVPGDARAAMLASASTPYTDLSLAGATSVSALGGAGSGVIASVEARTVTTTLYDGSILFTGATLNQFEVNVPVAGTLSGRLEDLAFPSLAGALSFALIENGEVLGVLDGPGSFEFEVGGPARMFAFVFAVGTPGPSIGSYYLNLTHQYEEPVPLPASIWLLLSASGLLGWLGRRRRRDARQTGSC
jgi:hypothetical protein